MWATAATMDINGTKGSIWQLTLTIYIYKLKHECNKKI
jgi:hypothetical protein